MKKWIFLFVCSIIGTTTLNAQNVGINTVNPTEQLHIHSDSTKVALRMDSKKSVDFGVNYFNTIATPTNVQNFVINPAYTDWTDLNFTKLVNSDDNSLQSPNLNIYPEIANPLRIKCAIPSSIPSNANITNITFNAEWKRNGTGAGELRLLDIYITQESTNILLLTYGFEKITSSTDVTVSIPYQQVYNAVTPDMLNLGDFFISLINLHSVSPGISKLEIDKIWLDVEYSVPANGSENVFWTTGAKEGTFKVTNSNDLQSKIFLTIDETGVTQLKGLKIAKNAGTGKVLTSNQEGNASWANLPSNIVNSLNDLLDVKTDTSNIYIGQNSGENDTTGTYNTASGHSALKDNISGDKNTAFGGIALSNNTTGSQNTALGYSAFSSVGVNYSNSTGIGYDAEPDASNTVRIGNSSVSTIGGFANWTNVSDKRFKTNIEENIVGLDFIMKLRPVSYNLDLDAIASIKNTPNSLRLSESETLKAAEVQTGFIAQEVQQAAQETGFIFHGIDTPKNEHDHYGLRYAEFVVPLVKAMQEQQQTIEKQQQEIDVLKELVKQLLGK